MTIPEPPAGGLPDSVLHPARAAVRASVQTILVRAGRIARWAAVAGAIAVAGCAASVPINSVEVARKTLIGFSEEDMRLCAGFPDRSYDADGTTVWSYVFEQRTNGVTLGAPVLYGLASTSVSLSSAGNCKMQVRFRDGRVDRVAYAGDNDTAQGRDTVCTPIVDDCLSYAREHGVGHPPPRGKWPKAQAPAQAPRPSGER